MVVVRLDGELDLASAPLLESEMERPEVGAAARVVLDLRELQFIDSTGLRTIFTAQARSRDAVGNSAPPEPHEAPDRVSVETYASAEAAENPTALEREQEFAVTRGPEQVQRLLSITRLAEHLRIVDSPEQMLP